MEEFSILVDFKPCGSLTKDIYVISIEIFSSAIHCIPARSSIVNWNRIGQSEIFSSVFNARPLWSDIIVNHHHHYHHHYHHNPPTYHSFHIINIERFLSGTQSWKSSALGWVIIIIYIDITIIIIIKVWEKLKQCKVATAAKKLKVNYTQYTCQRQSGNHHWLQFKQLPTTMTLVTMFQGGDGGGGGCKIARGAWGHFP